MFSKIAVVFLALVAIQVNADVFPKVVNTTFQSGYMPVGFDNNDNVQLVAEGVFSNTCYKPGSVKAVVSEKEKTIYLYPRAYKYDGVCLQMTVPWTKEIDLGLLKTGTYKVVNVSGKDQKLLGELPVTAATNNDADDFLYAPVSQAMYEKHEGFHFIRVTGDFPQTCLKMKEIVVRVQSNTLVVQPIAEKTDEVCEAKTVHYSQLAEITDAKPGRYLLHVRSLNGKSVNNIVEIE
jgi:hypothetical protein